MIRALESALAPFRSVRDWIGEMTDPDAFLTRPGWYGAVAILASILAGCFHYATATVATDDALIYFRVARYIQEGAGPVLNAGDAHTPVTSVLWAYVLAWTSTLLGTGDMPALSRGLAAAFIALSSLLLSLSFRRSMGVLAILAPSALISVPLFRALMGLETALAVFALCLVHWCYFGLRSPTVAAAALAFGFFCRGDVILLGVPLGLLILFDRQVGAESILVRIRRATFAFGAVFLLGLGLQYLATGQFLPATLHAKIIQGRGGPWATYAETAATYVYQNLANRWSFAGLALMGLLASRVAGASLLAIAFLHWTAYAMLSVANYPWYSWLIALSLRLMTLFGAGALLMLCGSGLAHLIGKTFGFARIERSMIARWCLLVITLGIVNGYMSKVPAAARFEHNAALSGAGYMKAYYELAEVACRDVAEAGKDRQRSAVLLAQEIGLIGYVCPRLEVRDVNGLASPDITLETLNNWSHWVALYEPRYLCMRGNRGRQFFVPSADGAGFRYQVRLLHLKYGFPISLYQRVDAEGMPNAADARSEVWHPEVGLVALFEDGFEIGDTSAWRNTVGVGSPGI